MTNQSRGSERDIRVAVGDVGLQPCHVSQTAALTAACLQHAAIPLYSWLFTCCQWQIHNTFCNIYISDAARMLWEWQCVLVSLSLWLTTSTFSCCQHPTSVTVWTCGSYGWEGTKYHFSSRREVLEGDSLGEHTSLGSRISLKIFLSSRSFWRLLASYSNMHSLSSMAHRVKPLLTGHEAHWADDSHRPGFKSSLERGFQLH